MKNDFLLVSRKILPEYLDKVIYARNLLERHEASTITEAVQIAGISRNTYYKYKDYVYEPGEGMQTRHAVISLILKDQNGALSEVINQLTSLSTSILTISQAIPISGRANVLISLDISSLNCSLDEMTTAIRRLPGCRSVHLDGVD